MHLNLTRRHLGPNLSVRRDGEPMVRHEDGAFHLAENGQRLIAVDLARNDDTVAENRRGCVKGMGCERVEADMFLRCPLS